MSNPEQNRSTAKPARPRGWRARLRRFLPAAEAIRHNRWIGWLGPAIHHPRLWHLNRHGVALGLAIGLFFGLIIPLAQIPLSAAAAVMLRANLLVAVGSTLVTNPFTFAPLYFFAYRLGSFLTGEGTPEAAQAALGEVAVEAAVLSMGWAEKIVEIGIPLIVGLSVLAIATAVLAYFTVLILWRAYVLTEWRRRRRARQP
ncbi:MAG: DUF2062 domain-containing protein [Burkholderiales bacterium]